MRGKLFLITCIFVFLCIIGLSAGEKTEEQNAVMEKIRAKLQEFGWRVLYYESSDRDIWGNQGVGEGGYIVGTPPGMSTTKIATLPQMLSEKELKTLEDDISEAINGIELQKEQRGELEYYLAQVESQLVAYREQFEVRGGVAYTVQKNDSLWRIAKREYGDANKWPIIYRANQDKIKNPNLIRPGQELQIPQIKIKK